MVETRYEIDDISDIIRKELPKLKFDLEYDHDQSIIDWVKLALKYFRTEEQINCITKENLIKLTEEEYMNLPEICDTKIYYCTDTHNIHFLNSADINKITEIDSEVLKYGRDKI